jgi:hypothetical protein
MTKGEEMPPLTHSDLDVAQPKITLLLSAVPNNIV